jgi:microcystin-dependent protein
MRNLFIGLACVSSAFAAAPAHASAEPILAEIILVPFDFCPTGFLPTDGRLMPIAQNAALFSLLGNAHGGDGKTTFAIPKLDGPEGTRYCIAVQGVYPPRP